MTPHEQAVVDLLKRDLFESRERERVLREQKTALVAKRVELTEAIGAAATVLYRESSGAPNVNALRSEAKRLDGLLLAHRRISALRATSEEPKPVLLLGHEFVFHPGISYGCLSCGQPESAHEPAAEPGPKA